MAELSHRALRELIEGFGGCSQYYTEMISAGALLGGGPFEAWYIDAEPCPGKLVYQLAGGDADQLVRAAAFLDKRECAGIDINMGCAAPAITRTGAGVRWMADIEKAASLMAGIRKVVHKRLSVKLRIGMDDDLEYLCRFCQRLEEAGVDFITLHPRTAREKFKRRCRWEYVARLREALKIPVGGNGDIGSAKEMLDRAKDCDAVMTGRLAVRQPWIFARARALEQAEETADIVFGERAAEKVTDTLLEATGLKFLELLAQYQPPEFYPSRARRFFSYFCDNLKWGNYLKTLLNRENSLLGIERVWTGYFSERREEDF